MGVADGDRTVADGVAEVLGHRRRNDAACRRHVGDAVERVGERAQQAGATGVVERERSHHTVEHLDVVGERFGVGIDHDQRRPPEPVELTIAGGVGRAEQRWRELREHRVRRRFDVQRDRSSDGIDGVVGSTRMDALQRGERAVVVEVDDQPFALESGGTLMEAEVDHRLDPAARPTRAGSHR